jgi:hypothetical protein
MKKKKKEEDEEEIRLKGRKMEDKE